MVKKTLMSLRGAAGDAAIHTLDCFAQFILRAAAGGVEGLAMTK